MLTRSEIALLVILAVSSIAFLTINKKIKVLMRRNTTVQNKLRNLADCALNDDLDAFEEEDEWA